MLKWGEKIFKPTNLKLSLHQNSNDNSVRVVNCVTSECESTAGQ